MQFTEQELASLCSDDTFWKRRLESDFNFSGAGTARTSGWKFIYRGLFNPRGAYESYRRIHSAKHNFLCLSLCVGVSIYVVSHALA